MWEIFADKDCTISLTEIPHRPTAPHATEHCSPIASTCTQEGRMEHYKCRICGQLFRNSAGTDRINGSIALPLEPHIFENEECINCHHTINIIDYEEYLITALGKTVSVCGFVTAINADTSTVYIQYEDYAYKLINAKCEDIEVDDIILAVGLKARNSSVNCSYISHYEPNIPVSAPTPYNATSLFVSGIENASSLNQYTYVELNNITLLHSVGNEYVMAYMDIADTSQRLIYFTLDAEAPISTDEANIIKGNFAPMRLATVRGLVYQDGARLTFIPISADFISNVLVPVEITPHSKLRYESLVYQFNYQAFSESCVIELNCTPLVYEEVRIRWISQSDNVVINTENEICTATITVNNDETVCLIAEFSTNNTFGKPITITVSYYINLIK